jgi:hypothetical protein
LQLFRFGTYFVNRVAGWQKLVVEQIGSRLFEARSFELKLMLVVKLCHLRLEWLTETPKL